MNKFEFFFPLESKMKDSKYIFDSWFDELFDELSWDFVCEEQNNYDKAVYLAMTPIGRRGSVYDEMDFTTTQKTIL